MSDARDPSTIAHAAANLRASRDTCFELRVTAGPDAGLTISVSARSPGRMLIGTGEACNLRLADRRASRRHLALEAGEAGLRVTDLGSTNGTRIGGLEIVEAVCRGGELITIGDTTLRVDIDRAGPEPADVRMAFGPLLGASLAMRRLYRTCDALASATSALLIEGEPGTGKSTLAHALHLARRDASGASSASGASGAFVVVEGAAVGEVLGPGRAAGELDALVAEAVNGTLFVREVGDVPHAAQPALARFVAGAPARGLRIVASTARNLDAAVEDGTFAEELAHELASRIELPPLRERRGDIALLVEHFCRELGVRSETIAPKKLSALVKELIKQRHPENVTSLKTAVAHFLADVAGASSESAAAGVGLLAGAGGASGAGDPAQAAAAATPEGLGLETTYRDLLVSARPFAEVKQQLLDRFAGAYVTYAVAAHGGHVARAAAASGLAPRYFNLLRARSRSGEPHDDG